MILIGLTGTHGAGKGTVTNYLRRVHHFYCVSVSDFLAQEAVRRNLEPNRTNRANIANEYRKKGKTALMEATYNTIPQDEERVVLEPQYTIAEINFIREKGGYMIALDAERKVRYNRVHVRGSAKDDVSFEAFCRHEDKEMGSGDPEKQSLRDTMQSADIVLENNGSVEELEMAVKNLLQEQFGI
jgi:dephospho-CoA kinase